MFARIRERRIGRLGLILGILAVLFGVGTLALTPAHLILLLNGLALAAGAGVSAAYLPIAARALRRPDPAQGDVFGAGLCLSGLSDAALRLQSIIARDFGWPGIFNTPIAAVSIFLGVLALVAFLWAPHAEHGNVPREKWTRALLVIAAGVAIAVAAGLVQRGLAPPQAVRLE